MILVFSSLLSILFVLIVNIYADASFLFFIFDIRILSRLTSKTIVAYVCLISFCRLTFSRTVICSLTFLFFDIHAVLVFMFSVVLVHILVTAMHTKYVLVILLPRPASLNSNMFSLTCEA